MVDNARHLAAELESHGLRIPYGGTDTHMLLVDCKSVRSDYGASPDGKKGTPLMGDVAPASWIWPASCSTATPSPATAAPGTPAASAWARPGSPSAALARPRSNGWLRSSARLLKATEPYAYAGRHGPVYRAKVDFDTLEQAKWDVVKLACCVDLDAGYCPSGYPHHYFMHKPTTDPGGEWDIIEIEGTPRPWILQRGHDQ